MKGRPSWNKGKKHSPESLLKMSIAHKNRFKDKTNHPRWISDRTKLKTSERKKDDVQYIYWAKAIKTRDKWTCALKNNECRGRLEAHHILPWRDYPELRYEIKNGITLCHLHHPHGYEEEKRLAPLFMELVSVSKDLL